MITIQNLKGDSRMGDPKIHAAKPIENVQSWKNFNRRIKHSKNLITAESSAGGSVALPISELWKMFEAHDVKLAVPQVTVNQEAAPS